METHTDTHAAAEKILAAETERRAPERWEIDRSRSTLTFTLRELLVHRVSGTFGSWGGTLFLDRRRPSRSSVRVWVDLDSVDTQSVDRDIQLCSAEFFDVARYPRAAFHSTSIKVDDGDVVVKGQLNLHGVLRAVALSITPITMPESATIGQRETFVVRAKLNRKDFGLRWEDPAAAFMDVAVGDQVHLEARIEVVRAVDNS